MLKSIGASMATETFEIIENVASRGTLPPSMPVMTGAAVAVGQRKHISVPWARSMLNGAKAIYETMAAPICTLSSPHDSAVTLNSLGLTRQYVMSSITKIR